MENNTKVKSQDPVEKIGEEDDIRRAVLSFVNIEHFRNDSTITLPFYFADSDKPLKLWLSREDGVLYVSDRGRVYSEILRHCDMKTAKMMAKYFARIYFEAELYGNMEYVAVIRDVQAFITYLQTVALIANAHMYPTVDEWNYERYKKYSRKYKFPQNGENAKEFLEELFGRFTVTYDKRLGTCLHFPFYFHSEGCPMVVRFIKEGEMVRVTDFGDFDGGRLFDRMCWLNDDIHIYDDKIKEICDRYGCVYNGEQIFYSFDPSSEGAVGKAIFTFMQVASILGEIGEFIVI